MSEKKFQYITTTLPYVNADLHMGHALELVRADIIARTKALQGFDVYFNTGTDEHGMKIYEKAQSLGKDPQTFVDASFKKFQESVAIFNILDSAHFIRTTDPHHIASAQEFWKRCNDNGFIYKKNYQSKYCVGCEETKTDSDLVNGECPIHPGPLQLIDEENYFFKYSAFTEKLLKFYEANPNFVVPDFRYNEIKAFVSRGLEDFSISRLKSKMPWGIEVPGDADHVMYVWFDALTNYISTLGWPTVGEGTPFQKYWVNGNPIQYCGKDNLRFQSAMWQAMLMAADIQNSHQIVINGFITAEGGVKMSKTLGNTVDPKDIVAKYGTDALRFFLAKEVGSFEDSPFTEERFKASYNAHLANGLGNLVSRLMNMSVSYDVDLSSIGSNNSILKSDYFYEFLSRFDIKAAVEHAWDGVTVTDSFIQTREPFKLIKTDPEQARNDIKQAVQQLYDISQMLLPVIPETAEKILMLIKANKKPETPLFMRKE